MSQETFEQMALRVAPEYADKEGRIVLIHAFATRIRDELCKSQEPVAEVVVGYSGLRLLKLVATWTWQSGNTKP